MASPDERDRVLAFFQDRFGIPPETFAPYLLLVRGRNIWIVTRSSHLEVVATLLPHTIGLRLARETNLGIKPTTYGLQLFGHLATRNVVDLDRQQVLHFLRGNPLSLSATASPGFVVVRHDGLVVGCGLYKGIGVLQSLIPKKIRLDSPRLDSAVEAEFGAP